VLLGGDLAASRVQKGYDRTTAAGERVQVRYGANPADRWIKEHLVDFRADCDRYALVIFEASTRGLCSSSRGRAMARFARLWRSVIPIRSRASNSTNGTIASSWRADLLKGVGVQVEDLTRLPQ
jgi:hypothetical protein